MTERRRQLILAGAAAAGLVLVLALSRRRSGSPTLASTSAREPTLLDEDGFSVRNGGGGGGGGGGFSGFSLPELIEAVKGLVPAPAAPAPVNVTVTNQPPAATPAPISPPSAPGGSSDPTPVLPAGNYQPPRIVRQPSGVLGLEVTRTGRVAAV